MTLSRFKIHKEDFAKAVKYLTKSAWKKDTPAWIVKNKQNLQVKDGKVLYNDKPIVPIEGADDYLRGLVFGKDSKTPLSRDGMFHLVKSEVAGISRRRIMDFLRGQSVVQKGKGAVPVQKLSGKPLKNYHIEFDLVFVKKTDVVKANPHFKEDETLDGLKNNKLTYILSVVEKVTGLTRLEYVTRKEAKIVSPLVVKAIKSIASALKTPTKQIDASSDRGDEFSPKVISPHVKSYEFVPTGSSIEKKNSDIQRVLFQLLRARRGKSFKGLVKRTEEITNNNLSRITHKTPNEAVEAAEPDSDLKSYNAKRAKGSTGAALSVGDHVRVRILKIQKGLGLAYKSYKNMLWSDRVYKISAKSSRKPSKYRVGKKWYLTSMLMRSKPIDAVSEAIIKKRDTKSQAAKRKGKEEVVKDMEARMKKDKTRRRPRREAAVRGRQKALASKRKEMKLDKLLGT
jgi:hypothetical protein